MSEIERVNEEPEFREYMSAEEDNRKIENSIRSEGYEDGVEYGINLGKTEGRNEGKIEGIATRNKEIAQEMKKKNYSMEEISQLTGLDPKEIEKL